MLRPIMNLYTKNGSYRKTILFDIATLELILQDTADVENADQVKINYEVLAPIEDFERDGVLRYDDCSLMADICVPLFSDMEDNTKKRNEYLCGLPTQSMVYVKYPQIGEEDAYKVMEINFGSFAGTGGDEDKDMISLYISFFNGFIESEVEEWLEDKQKARQMIPTVTTSPEIDAKITEANNARIADGRTPVEYRYHMIDGKALLLASNLEDLTARINGQTFDFSMFDCFGQDAIYNIVMNLEYALGEETNASFTMLLSETGLEFIRKAQPVDEERIEFFEECLAKEIIKTV